MPRAFEVPSPCVKVCRMNESTGLCHGCLRTLDEIARWSSMTANDRLAVLHELGVRRRAQPPAAGAACAGGRG